MASLQHNLFSQTRMSIRWIKRILRSVISWTMSLTYLFAFQIPQHDGRVTDTADMISDIEESQLESQLQKLHDETGVEIAILTVPTTDGHDIAQLGVEVGQSRWIGKKDISNGILILIAAQDRKWDISTGYGVEWVIPDIIAYRMGKEIRVPNARKQQYYRWFSEIIRTISGLIHGDKELMEYWSGKNQDTKEEKDTIPLLAMLGVIIWVLIWSALQKTRKKQKTKKAITAFAWSFVRTLIVWLLVGAVGLVVFLPSLLGRLVWLYGSSSGWLLWRGYPWFGGWFSSDWRSSWWGSFGWWFGWFGGGSFGGGGASGSR